MKKIPQITKILLIVVAALLIGVNVYLFNANTVVGNTMPMPFGYGVGVVLSGSMEPQLKIDDVIIVKETNDYTVGDVVVFQTGTMPVVHQIIEIEGETVTTKGIANNAPDEPITMGDIKGELVATIPGAGKLINAIKTPAGAVIILILAFLLLELSYRGEKKQDDDDLERIKEEIRKLKEETDHE